MFEVFTEFSQLWLVATQMFSDLCELWELFHLRISVCLCSVSENLTLVLNNNSRRSHADFWSSSSAQLPSFWNFAIQLLAVSLDTNPQMLSSARLACSSWDPSPWTMVWSMTPGRKPGQPALSPHPHYSSLSDLMDHILPHLLSIA